MKSILVKTGYGYFEDAVGNIVGKAELPIGYHKATKGYSYIEVADKAELDAIQVHQDPADVLAAQQNKRIADKLRQLAIDSLVSDGDWP